MAIKSSLALSQFKEQNPSYAAIPDEELAPYLHQKYYSNLPFKEFSKAIGYQDPNEPGDFHRGASEAIDQLKPTGLGLLAGAAATGESVTGKGGIMTGIKNYAVKGMQEANQKIAENSNENDNITTAWEKAKQGDLGALVDWTSHGLGYAAAQTLMAGGTALAGAALAPEAAIGAAAVGGTSLAKGLIQKAVSNEAGKLAASGVAESEIQKLAVSNVAKQLASTAALATYETGMEGGEIGGGLAEKSVNENRELTPSELAKGLGATIIAAGGRTLVDSLNLSMLKGDTKGLFNIGESMSGIPGKLARGASMGAKAGLAEGGEEGFQTYAEEFGQGNDLSSPETTNQVINSVAQGALGGHAVGFAGGLLSQQGKVHDKDPIGKIATAPTVDEAIKSFGQAVEQTPEQQIEQPVKTQSEIKKGIEFNKLFKAEPDDRKVVIENNDIPAHEFIKNRIINGGSYQSALSEFEQLHGQQNTPSEPIGSAEKQPAISGSEKPETETKTVKSPDKQIGEFKPTHFLSDGTQVKHIENNAYADKHGNEFEDDYATEIKNANHTGGSSGANNQEPAGKDNGTGNTNTSSNVDVGGRGIGQESQSTTGNVERQLPDQHGQDNRDNQSEPALVPDEERVTDNKGELDYLAKKEQSLENPVVKNEKIKAPDIKIETQIEDILTKKKASYIAGRIKKFNTENPKAIKSERDNFANILKSNYESDYNKALANAPYDYYASLPEHKDISENVLRQGYNSLREEHNLGEHHAIEKQEATQPNGSSSTQSEISQETENPAISGKRVRRSRQEPGDTSQKIKKGDSVIENNQKGTVTKISEHKKFGTRATVKWDDGKISVRPIDEYTKESNDQNQNATKKETTAEEKVNKESKETKPSETFSESELNKKPDEETSQKKDSKIAEENIGKLSDFGEKLGGAKKDKVRVKTDITSDEIRNLSLSKLWPKETIADEADDHKAAFMQAIRDEIPSKPKSEWKLKSWVKKVEAVLEIVKELQNGDVDYDEFLKSAEKRLPGITDRAKLLSNLDRDQWPRIGKVHLGRGKFGKELEEKNYVSVEIDGRQKFYQDAYNTEDALNRIKKDLEGNAPEKKMKFEVRGRFGEYFINKVGDTEYRKLKTFTDSKEALAYKNEHNEDLVKLWDNVKERDNVREEDTRNEENRPRTAKDWRKGENITPETFQETFGFRGGEFGNWVNQGAGLKERQWMLNGAFDALMDLSDILRIPPNAISLNGKLGIGFGSRGSGKASAHYEPHNEIINLTKTRGAGTLAHEWFHALDNYFSKLREGGEIAFNGNNNTYRNDNYITHKPEPLYVIKKNGGSALTKKQLNDRQAKYLSSGFYNPENWHLDPNHRQGVRSEVEDKFARLVDTLNDSPMAKRALTIDKGKKGYWSSVLEMAARSFENYVIVKMDEQGFNNDYLANIKDFESFKNPDRYPYHTKDEIAPIAKAFDDLFDTIEHKETDKGTMLYSKGSSTVDIEESPISFETDRHGANDNGKERGLGKVAYAKSNQGNGSSVSEVIAALPTRVNKLIDSGKLEIVQSHDSNSEGFYDSKADKITLVADNISADNINSVLSHELIHRAEAKNPKVKETLNRFEASLNIRWKLAVKGKASAIENKAADRVIAAGTPYEDQLSEYIAYQVSEYQNNPDSFTGIVAKAFKDLIAAIRMALLRSGMDMGFIKSLSAADLVAMSKYGAYLNAAETSGTNTNNTGEFNPNNNNILYSKASIIGNSNRNYTPGQLKAMEETGSVLTEKSVKERVAEMRKDIGKKMAQGIADQFAPVKEITQKGYSLLRLSKGSSGAFEALLKHGKLSLKDGATDADTSGGALEKVFNPLGSESTDFLRWVAGNRAERLAGEGKENLFSPDSVNAFKSLNHGNTNFDYTLTDGKITRDRVKIYRDSLKKFNEFNKNVLDIAEQSGLIDPESRHLWEHEFYVPFYRNTDEGDFKGVNIKSGVVRQEAFKRLKGGQEKLNDLLYNTLTNWAHLIDASAKNRAATETLQAAERIGVAKKVSSTTKGAVWHMGEVINNIPAGKVYIENGVTKVSDGTPEIKNIGKVYYEVSDPFILTALNGLEYAGMRGPVMNAMTSFKRVLTIGVTASPFFKVRNLIRDSIQSIATADLDYNVAKNIKEGYKLTDKKNPSQKYVSALAGGGLIRFGTMLENNDAARVRQLIKEGSPDTHILDNEYKINAMIDKWIKPSIEAYNEIGNRSEEINRMALYDQLTEKGLSHSEASLQARDLLDFSMQGAWTSIRFLTQITPFMNARIQGLYKLGRATKEDRNRMAIVTGAVTLASLSLLAAYSDDDDWKKREDWDRDNYWWFKLGGEAYRIPKPFEIGAISTLAERSAEYLLDDEMTGKRFRQTLANNLSNQLSMNPVPQMFKPLLDVYANKDSFTGRSIESMGMENLLPDYRFNQNTSMGARALSTAGNAVTGDHFFSPVQIDHLIKGYFGWLGSFVVGGSDMMIRSATNEPTKPAADYFNLVTGGMVSSLSGSHSRYVTQFYDQAKELEEAYNTYNHLIKDGDREDAVKFKESHLEELKDHKHVELLKNRITKLNQSIKKIEISNYDSDIKREKINAYRDQQDAISRKIKDM